MIFGVVSLSTDRQPVCSVFICCNKPIENNLYFKQQKINPPSCDFLFYTFSGSAFLYFGLESFLWESSAAIKRRKKKKRNIRPNFFSALNLIFFGRSESQSHVESSRNQISCQISARIVIAIAIWTTISWAIPADIWQPQITTTTTLVIVIPPVQWPIIMPLEHRRRR